MGDNVRDKYYCELAWLMGQSPLYAKNFNEQAKKMNERFVQIEKDYANNPDNADFKMKKTPKMTIRPASSYEAVTWPKTRALEVPPINSWDFQRNELYKHAITEKMFSHQSSAFETARMYHVVAGYRPLEYYEWIRDHPIEDFGMPGHCMEDVFDALEDEFDTLAIAPVTTFNK